MRGSDSLPRFSLFVSRRNLRGRRVFCPERFSDHGNSPERHRAARNDSIQRVLHPACPATVTGVVRDAAHDDVPVAIRLEASRVLQSSDRGNWVLRKLDFRPSHGTHAAHVVTLSRGTILFDVARCASDRFPTKSIHRNGDTADHSGHHTRTSGVLPPQFTARSSMLDTREARRPSNRVRVRSVPSLPSSDRAILDGTKRIAHRGGVRRSAGDPPGLSANAQRCSSPAPGSFACRSLLSGGNPAPGRTATI